MVGVGSVGTLCLVALLMADDEDPLFLQIKEARASVFEAYAGKSAFRHQGQRVVHGHRLMQSASDIFLGWCTSKTGRHFYVRQLRDIKLKPILDAFSATDTIQFGERRGWTLARAHARSGEPAMIGGYLGSGEAFDKAIAAFSIAYADQTERDHELLRKAARAGKNEKWRRSSNSFVQVLRRAPRSRLRDVREVHVQRDPGHPWRGQSLREMRRHISVRVPCAAHRRRRLSWPGSFPRPLPKSLPAAEPLRLIEPPGYRLRRSHRVSTATSPWRAREKAPRQLICCVPVRAKPTPEFHSGCAADADPVVRGSSAASAVCLRPAS